MEKANNGRGYFGSRMREQVTKFVRRDAGNEVMLEIRFRKGPADQMVVAKVEKALGLVSHRGNRSKDPR